MSYSVHDDQDDQRAALYEQQQREHYAEQGLDEAIGTFGVPGVLQRIAARMLTPSGRVPDNHPF